MSMLARWEAFMEWFECLYCYLILYRKGEKLACFLAVRASSLGLSKDSKSRFLFALHIHKRRSGFQSRSHVDRASENEAVNLRILALTSNETCYGAKELSTQCLRRHTGKFKRSWREEWEKISIGLACVFVFSGWRRRETFCERSLVSRPKPWRKYNWIAINAPL